jgi:hypothetical protein
MAKNVFSYMGYRMGNGIWNSRMEIKSLAILYLVYFMILGSCVYRMDLDIMGFHCVGNRIGLGQRFARMGGNLLGISFVGSCMGGGGIIYEDGRRFIGKCNVDGQPDGEGVMNYSDNGRYIGYCGVIVGKRC